jgi:hypothetical protein
MTKFRILGTALVVAVAAFTVSCDKDSLPEVKNSGAKIGDGETSALMINSIIDENITDLDVTYGDYVVASDLNYKETTEAFGIKTGKSLMTITAFDSEKGNDVVIYNDYVSADDEVLYMFVVSNDENGLGYKVDVLEYSSEDFQISDKQMEEYSIVGNNDEYYLMNAYNYNTGFEEGNLFADFGYSSFGSAERKEVFLGEYGTATTFTMDKDGYFTDLSFGTADQTNEQDAFFYTSLENLNWNFESNSNDAQLVNMFVLGDDNQMDFFFVDMSSLNIDYTTLNIEE